MRFKQLALLVLVLAALLAFFALDLGRFLSLDYLKQSQASFADVYARQPLAVAGAYFGLYVAATALSLPGAALGDAIRAPGLRQRTARQVRLLSASRPPTSADQFTREYPLPHIRPTE